MGLQSGWRKSPHGRSLAPGILLTSMRSMEDYVLRLDSIVVTAVVSNPSDYHLVFYQVIFPCHFCFISFFLGICNLVTGQSAW